MSRTRLLVAALAAALAGCAERAAPPRPALPAGATPRLAVLAFRVGGDLTQDGTFVPGAPGEVDDAAAGRAVARELTARLAEVGVAVADADAVAGATALLDTRSYDPRVARRVAARVDANLAVLGALSHYRQRQGTAWAAEVPASVAFQAALVRAGDGTVVTVERFAYTQQALSENLLGVGRFLEAGGRWLTREEILSGALRQTAVRFAAAARGETPARGPVIRLPRAP
jgi:hypothetical protein